MITRSKLPLFLIVLTSTLFVLIISWGISLEFSPEKTRDWNYLYNAGYSLLYFFGGVVGVFGSLKVGLKTNIGKAMLFLGLSLVSQTIALLIWTYYNIILHVAIPSPSLADLFFLVFFLPLATIGFIYLIMVNIPEFSIRYILESIAIFLISLCIIFGIADRPDVSSSHNFIINLINISYPFVDSILLSVSVIAFRGSLTKFSRGAFVIALGFLAQVIADIIYAYRVEQGSYWNGDIADKGWTTAAYIMSLGMILLLSSFYDSQKVKPVTTEQ